MGETETFDVIVVGAGMGGCVAAGLCAEAGLNVALLEVGQSRHRFPGRTPTLLEKLSGRARSPTRWPHELEVATKPGRYRNVAAVQGIGAGGSATVYGACLNRMRRSDFEIDDSELGENEDDRCLPNAWPISYDEMAEHYAALERVFDVAGSPDPLDPDQAHNAIPSGPPLRPKLNALVEDLQEAGLHPYQLPFASRRLTGCSECLGVPCTRECKSDSYNRVLMPNLNLPNMFAYFGAEVDAVLRVKDQYRVEVSGERPAVLKAPRVVLAAGVLQTPLLLMRSGDLWDQQPDLLGRGLMFHSSETLAVSAPSGEPESGPLKSLAFRDFYRMGDVPGGEIQSLGIPASSGVVHGYLAQEAARLGFSWLGPGLTLLRIPAMVAARRFSSSILMSTIVEDLPYHRNRVTPLGSRLGARVNYHISTELRERCKLLRTKLKSQLVNRKVTFLSALANLNLGHGSGTCRMGLDPSTSVLAPDGSVWGLPGLFVVDASAFPSSSAANPSLTIAANARRIVLGSVIQS